MFISKFPGHMRSAKLNFSATVLGLKAKIYGNLNFVKRKFRRELRTCSTLDRCVDADHNKRRISGQN